MRTGVVGIRRGALVAFCRGPGDERATGLDVGTDQRQKKLPVAAVFAVFEPVRVALLRAGGVFDLRRGERTLLARAPGFLEQSLVAVPVGIFGFKRLESLP